MFRLDGMNALVTGASGGIGSAIAIALAKQGARVALSGSNGDKLRGFREQLIEEVKLTQEQLSVRVGKKRSTVTNFLRLLKLDPIIQTGMRDGFLSMGHGRALINMSDQATQLEIYQRIIKDNLSVRQTEQLVKNYKSGRSLSKEKSKGTQTLSAYLTEGASAMSSYLGQKIEVKTSGKDKGKIIIPFHSEEDFKRIQKLLE